MRRLLPALWEFLAIGLFTRKRDWTETQSRMMRRAGRFHAARTSAAVAIVAALAWGGLAIRDKVSERSSAESARALVDRLVDAEMEKVPEVIGGIQGLWTWAEPILRNRLEGEPSGSSGELRLRLALLREDPGQVDPLFERMLTASPAEFAILRIELRPHADRIRERLWERFDEGDPDARFRAACALVDYDAGSDRAGDVARAVAEHLVTQNPFVALDWLASIRPLGASHIRPFADLLLEAEGERVRVLLPAFEDHPDRAAALFESEVDREPEAGWEEKDRKELAKRRANAAIALLELGRHEKTWRNARHTPDPTARSFFIHRLAAAAVDPRKLVRRFEAEGDVSARRAFLLAIGEYGKDALPASERESLLPKLLDLYRSDSDPGIHGAVEWLLRQWGKQDEVWSITDDLATEEPVSDRGWYVTKLGQTMVVVRGPKHSFAIGQKEVTVEEFWRLDSEVDEGVRRWAPADDCPILRVTWYEAARYCNRLSAAEGIPKEEWCYEPNHEGKYAEGMRLKANWTELKGYRLPTEEEWEYACQAGSVTSRYYGEGDDLLGDYAWFYGNSPDRSQPVGTRKPNDFGLFDMLGNVAEWCQDDLRGERPVEDSLGGGEEVPNYVWGSLRGGAFDCQPSVVRTAGRDWVRPSDRNSDFGFRAARTYR